MSNSNDATTKSEQNSVTAAPSGSQMPSLAESPSKTNERRSTRKPNFTVPERMYLAQSYAEKYDEFNQGFTPATKGQERSGRQRLLRKWAFELTTFGVAERTPAEVEQRLRDYLKKISAIRRRKIGPREMSPACALINSVISTSRRVENVTINDRMTEAAGFLLQQHQAYYPDSAEFEPQTQADVYDEAEQALRLKQLTREERQLRLEIARKELEVKKMELKLLKVKLEIKSAEINVVAAKRRKIEPNEVGQQNNNPTPPSSK
ncbi:unnamed protein product [Gongylonema pulchrum]|uniref:Myb_DNA-bind_5 domain-containing protein n=1 Tax=Gongylonema pulchrum TaxID=637853 RepID=A0A183DZ92_9BILA|nr:unnamed protein product [Gongylonema pulchrum]